MQVVHNQQVVIFANLNNTLSIVVYIYINMFVGYVIATFNQLFHPVSTSSVHITHHHITKSVILDFGLDFRKAYTREISVRWWYIGPANYYTRDTPNSVIVLGLA